MNSEEFRAFYRRYYDVSVKLASRIVQSHFTAEDVTQEVFLYFYRIKDRLDMSSERKLYSLVVTETTNKGRDYLRKSYVKREVMFDNEVSELQYKSVESAEAALLGMEKAQYITMAFENLHQKNPVNYEIFMRVVMLDISTDEVARELTTESSEPRNGFWKSLQDWTKNNLTEKAYLCRIAEVCSNNQERVHSSINSTIC